MRVSMFSEDNPESQFGVEVHGYDKYPNDGAYINIDRGRDFVTIHAKSEDELIALGEEIAAKSKALKASRLPPNPPPRQPALSIQGEGFSF